MTTESVNPTKQPAISASQTLLYSTAYGDNNSQRSVTVTAGTKTDSGGPEKVSCDSSSGDEESTDEPGNLVIDLGNDNDAEKAEKGAISTTALYSSGSDGTVRNDNNNNSVEANTPCSNKRSNSEEKSGRTKAGCSTDDLSSCNQNSCLNNPSKSVKTKSKKTVKSSKHHTAPNTAPVSGLRTESPSLLQDADVANISSNLSSNKQTQSFDSNLSSAQTGCAPDETTGKKSKSSKSKSHHKKHKHGEKKNSSNNGVKSDALGEKSKSKSKHGSTLQPNVSTSSAFSASGGAHVLPPLVSASSSSIAIANKSNFGACRSDSPISGNLMNAQSLSYAQKTTQMISHGRGPTRTALNTPLTSSGAKITQSCNKKEEGNDSVDNHNQQAKKKLRKSQLANVTSSNSSEITSTRAAITPHTDNCLIQPDDSNKRDRSDSNSLLSESSVTEPKKPRLDMDRKSGSGSANSLSSHLRVASQFKTANIGENRRSTTPLQQPDSSKISRPDVGELGRTRAGNKSPDYGMTSVAPPVFAPSILFAHSMPRLNVSRTGEYTTSSPLSETSSVWSSASSNCSSDSSRVTTNTAPSVTNSHRSVGTVTSTCDVGVLTEPDALGPCEPGTSVHLDGIVWHETDTGMLVVNVTWRNRTYVGTLLDATKHDWAPPRFVVTNISSSRFSPLELHDVRKGAVRHLLRACGCVFGKTLNDMPEGGHEDWLPCLPVHLIQIFNLGHKPAYANIVFSIQYKREVFAHGGRNPMAKPLFQPRFSDSDMDMELRAKNGRPKRARGAVADATRKGRSRGGAQYVPDDVKGSPSAAAKRRNKNLESELATTTDNDNPAVLAPRSSKRARLAAARNKDLPQQLQAQSERSTNGGSGSSSCSSPVSIECPHPKCSKRYKHISGLNYHQTHAHGDDVKESGDLNDDDGMVSDQTGSPPEEEARSSDPERISLAGKDGESVKENDSSKASSDALHTKSDVEDEDVPSDIKEKQNQYLTTEASFPEQKPTSTLASASQGKANACTTTSLQDIPKLLPVTSGASTTTLTTPGAHDSSYSISQSNSHPLKTLQSAVSSVVHAALLKTTGTTTHGQRHATGHPLTSDANAADNESAQAVQTLLQLQGPNDQSLPGLSTPYSQDSPHPTLTLVSRAGQTSLPDNLQVAPSSSRISGVVVSSTEDTYKTTWPSETLTQPRTVCTSQTAQSEVRTTLECNVISSLGSQAPRIAPATGIESVTLSSHSTTVSFSSQENAYETTSRNLSVERTPKESYFASVYTPASHPQGTKIAKGKTVPIPIDPNQNLTSSYAGKASPGSLATSTKKVKRKKKFDQKSSSSTSTPESDFRSGEGNFPLHHQPQPRTSATPCVSVSSPVSSVIPAATTTSIAPPVQSPQKTRSIAFKSNETPVVLTSNQDSMVHVKTEGNLRLPPQHFAGKKLPGVVLHATSTQNHFSNNITVTGTFHPHPDPHKPQTAVSAQAQDRIRANRPLTPSNMNSSHLKNNNHKHTGPQMSIPPGRPQLSQADLHSTKSKPPSLQVTSPSPEQSVQHDTAAHLPPRSRHSEPKSRPEIPEHISVKVISRFNNATADTYRDMPPRIKPSTPIPPDPPKAHEHHRPRPPSSEPRAVIIADNSPAHPRERSLINRSRPTPDAPIEIRNTSPNSQSKLPPNELHVANPHPAAYMSPMYAAAPHFMSPLGGIGYIPPMDPAYQQAAAAAQAQQLADPRFKQQFEQYIQELQKHSYLQHQQLLSQRQQEHEEKSDGKSDADGKTPSKVDYPTKSITQSNADQDKAILWPHQPQKRVSAGALSPFQPQMSKEKSPGGNTLHGLSHQPPGVQHPDYKLSQPSSLTSAPARCHSVIISSKAPLSGSSHSRSESLDRGRALAIEDRSSVRKSSASPMRTARSPEKPKEVDHSGPGVYRSSAGSPGGQLPHYPYPHIYDPSRATAFRGVHPFSMPGIPTGYVFPSGTTPMFAGPPSWVPGAPMPSGKQSPSLKLPKEQSPGRQNRSPSREDIARSRIGGKPRDPPAMHYGMKDRRLREVPSLPVRKLSVSPEPKSLVPVGVQMGRNSVGGPPPSTTHRPPSPPTQLHHHTHHHIHEAIPSQYAYPGPTVIAGSDAVAAYPVPYQKRD